MAKILHITNGDSLTEYLKEIDVKGDYATWREILCEGPTEAGIDSKAFYEKRIKYLQDTYDANADEYIIFDELNDLQPDSDYKEVVLWFEYDLFCHINLIACISLIHQRNIKLPIYLVCSGRVEGEKEMLGLGELSQEQLLKHYDQKILLNDKDKDLALTLWRIYCGRDHNLFKPYIVKPSSFKYLSNCLKAHLRRFPDSRTGLDTFEFNILKLINEKTIKSIPQLLGFAINHQGYYGYGDSQIQRMIEKLSPFYEDTQDGLKLNRVGHEIIHQQHHVHDLIKDTMKYGGVNRYDFHFNKKENRLVKTFV